MPKDTSIKTVLIVGSGPIIIGQACEFDYSGSQAARSLREEGINVILINSNPATIMTDPMMADKVYLLPLNVESIEQILQEQFIANDLDVKPQNHLLLITGPNMGGKSTYMRQNALIVLLAHIGSFVPASRVRLGPIDKLFTRIGASDDLASGRSTFMVEMTETAHILRQATQHSLVLIDEIGRGTSTHDGMALAYACCAYLANHIQCYTLFSTHYFELTRLSSQFTCIRNVHLRASLGQSRIVFLYHVEEGAASQSYGLEVAQLAGIPEDVLQLARGYLHHAEQAPRESLIVAEPKPMLSPAFQDLANINADNLTAREALDLIYRLKHQEQPNHV